MKTKPWKLLIAGVAVTIGAPLGGMIVTVVGMVRAFRELGDNGISDPNRLASGIGQVLWGTAGGLIVSVLIGLPLMIAGIVLMVRNSRPKQSAVPIP